MELSLFLAKFLGLYMLIVAAIWILRKRQFENGARAIISSSGLLFVAGAIHLMIGLAIVVSHHRWELNWIGLITLLGYLMIIQGIVRMSFGDETKNFALKALENWHWVGVLVLVVLGLVLTYNGFIDRPKPGILGFL